VLARPLALAALLVLPAVAGCAATGERPAVDRWEETGERRAEIARSARAEAPEPGPGEAVAELPADAGLPELLAWAEAHDAGLRAAYRSWEASLERVPQARNLPDPRFTWVYFIEPVETRVGPQRNRFGLSQTFPFFGKLGFRGEMAVHDANAAAACYEEARRQLRYRVTRSWNEYWLLGRSLAITRENVQLLKHLESVALASYSAGRAPHAAVIKAQIELGRLEDRLRTLEDRRSSVLAQLNADLGRPATAPLDWPDELPQSPDPPPDDELHDLLVENNPELAALAAERERESAAVALSGRSGLPDLTLGVEYIDTGEARMPNVSDSGKDAIMAMASVNIPLWFGKYGAEKEEARAREASAAGKREDREQQLLADLERVGFGLRDALRRIDLYEHTLLPKARQSVGVLEDAFTAGRADFLDLVDAQRTLLEFELALERASADRTTLAAELEMILGIDLRPAP
jgi:outer membrane protein TolC